MKFRNYLESIAGVGIYPLVSLIIFFGFFVTLLWYVFRLDRKRVESIKKIPLEDGTQWKGILPLLIFILLPAMSQAQDTKGSSSGTDLILYVVLSLLIAMIGILIVVMFQVIQLYRKLTLPAKAEDGSEAVDTGLFSNNWWMKFAGFGTPLQEEKDLLISEHDYDGIKELDNRMPPWLRFTFISTILIAVVYIFYYHFSGLGDLQIAELEKEIAQAEIQKKAYLEKVGASIDETSVTLLTDAATIKEGSVIFQEKCAACHGQDGGGTVGPNLTDEYWLHGGDIKDVFKTIKYGVPEKGMIAWEKQLPPMQIQKVASYIHSLKGTKPANPKEPQGELYVEEVSAK